MRRNLIQKPKIPVAPWLGGRFGPRRKIARATAYVICLTAASLLLSACASRNARAPVTTEALTSEQTAPVAGQTNAVRSDGALDKLWQERLVQRADFPIGPGDVLDLSVSNVKELDHCTVRVSGEGNILLPLLGTLRVAGLTEPEAVDRITDALHKYVYHPQVSLQVKTFSSRMVAVIGTVRSPGMYVLNGPSDTVHDLIERAGGLTDNAAREVLLTPLRDAPSYAATASHQGATNQGKVVAAAVNPSSQSSTTGPAVSFAPDQTALPERLRDNSAYMMDNSAYMIDLSGQPGSRNYSDIPVRPGDSLFVPPAGQASVVGWVYHPTVIPVAAGLTALGAVSAAGGTMYAADDTSVKVIRRQPDGEMRVIKVDLNAVKSGTVADVPLQANDVIDVGYAAAKLPGYALYYAVQGIFSWVPAAAIMSGVP
jgi:protein involved in polysaccharide export with SLBB domain